MKQMHEQKREGLEDFVKFALIALLIVVPIRWFIAQPFIVKGASMEPTFDNGDYLIVDQLSYRFEEPERGDVIIMRYPKDPSLFFIKRIIGLPGETVELVGKSIVIQKGAGSEPISIEQSFVEMDRLGEEYGVYPLGSGEYFVLGDNRIASSDSRSWGALPRGDIVGKAALRLLPLTHFDLSPGDVELPN